MIPALALLIAAYTIARLAQVFVEHSDSADRDKRIQLISVLGIIGIVFCVVAILMTSEAVDDALKRFEPPISKPRP